MRVLVTGSAGHLGEALMRTLPNAGHEAVGLDLAVSPFTAIRASIADRDAVARAMRGIDAVVHAATLHKPHVATHSRQDFVDTNITGTLNLLEEAAAAGVKSFVFTSTTSVYGLALTPEAGQPAIWVDEETRPIPKNIYGATKAAAEDLCQLFQRKFSLPAVVLRTSRFFPAADDSRETREVYEDPNVKTNEFLFRRADIEDIAAAHLRALEKAPDIGFGKYVISATSPFLREDVVELRADPVAVLRRRVPDYEEEYARRGWRMFPSIDRVYCNERGMRELGWAPKYDFRHRISELRAGRDPRSRLARAIGSKGYHSESFVDGPYPVEA